MKLIRRSTFNRIKMRLGRIYGRDKSEQLADRIYMLIGRYGVVPHNGGVGERKEASRVRWSEKDVVLITYGDMVQRKEDAPLSVLKEFCDRRLRGAINTVHVLPFFPSSSDAGFSVIDYRKVDPDLGAWSDLELISRDYGLMVDLVLNHCSRRSAWFRDYVNGIAPYSAYFQEVNPDDDLSQVMRPRPWPLFSETETARGLRKVWTTFSRDQVDLNWRSPDVLFEFLDLLLGYVARGTRIIRLDAVAFLWKESGTRCVHLPQTHEVVKLMRDVLMTVAPQVILLTETNVPHDENISYFGRGDEAHMVYQFALPPLLLHGLLRNDSTHLQKWARGLEEPPRASTFLNFTASHDGIGVRPLEGLVPAGELDWLVGEVEARNGLVSQRAMPDGSQKPYELNITYRSALEHEGSAELSARRFLCSQGVMLSLRGMPAIYFHSLAGELNWVEGPAREGGECRDINRRRWDWKELEEKLDDPEGDHAWIMNVYSHMLRVRIQCPAFHPDAPQEIVETDGDLFVVMRRSLCGRIKLMCCCNFTAGEVALDPELLGAHLGTGESFKNLLSGKSMRLAAGGGRLSLGAYELAWLVAE